MSARDDAMLIAHDAELDGRWDQAMAIRLECHERWPVAVEIGGENPTSRNDWSGSFISLDGCDNSDFTSDDIALVIAYGDTGEDWDGYAAGIVQLKDGRFVSWESDWGPTGSGFSHDAYGGTADIAFASSAGECLKYLSERSRGLLVWS